MTLTLQTRPRQCNLSKDTRLPRPIQVRSYNANRYSNDQAALAFFTGYLIEKSLSVDNIFVFVLIFTFFAVPPIYQHRVLFWGILGALLMRGALIAVGAALLKEFHWIIYVFGAFLIIYGCSHGVAS